jgi:hypothetical protein
MWNYHPDVVVQTFVRFHPGRSFTLQELRDYDAELFVTNDAFFTNALLQRGIQNPSTYDKSKLLQIACGAPGTFDAAVVYAAGAYARALSIGAIG